MSDHSINDLLDPYQSKIQQIAKGLLSLCHLSLSNPVVTVDGGGIGLDFGTGFKGLDLIITPFPTYVRLGIAKGAALEDPTGLLEGCGKVHRHIKIRELAELVSRAAGWTGEFIYDSTKPDGTPRKVMDVSKLESLGWRAQTPIEEGFRKSYAWYVDNVANRTATPDK